MTAILALALKDLTLLLRNRATLFFTFVWPLLMAIGFGLMFGGGGGDKA
ncbi:MAG: ABC transporter permease, partial [Lysobacterales bacterium CG_4_9_14_3_um_filter_62_6]